jgi:hypothetical protein
MTYLQIRTGWECQPNKIIDSFDEVCSLKEDFWNGLVFSRRGPGKLQIPQHLGQWEGASGCKQLIDAFLALHLPQVHDAMH